MRSDRIGNGGACDKRAVDAAEENLTRSFSALGFCVRFKGSLMLMAKAFGREVRFMKIKSFERSSRPMVESRVSRPHKGA
jgi:hypothetical protein